MKLPSLTLLVVCGVLPLIFASDVVVGIDLGTTYSAIGIYRNSRVEIIPNESGDRLTPSVVGFDQRNDERLIGQSAKNFRVSHPESIVYDVKRLMGKRYDSEDIQEDVKRVPFDVVRGPSNKALIQLGDKPDTTFSPEEVSSMILQKLKQSAESYLGEPITRAVITVPAYFNDAQRKATRDAGTIAGLRVERVLNEPTAAAMAFGMDKGTTDRNILVFDLGGGTFDVSLLYIDDDVFEVLATAGDTHLGGEDFDARVVDYLVKEFKKSHGVDLKTDLRALQLLKREAEKAKRVLSGQQETRISIENLHSGQDFSLRLSRAKFEQLNNDLFRKTLLPVQQVLRDAGLKKSDIDDLVLIGGSTRIPKIRSLVSNFFDGKKPVSGINPDEAVAYGATIHAASLAGLLENPPLLIDVTPLTLGIETVGGIMTPLIHRNAKIPTEKEQVFTTAEDGQPSVVIKVLEGERKFSKDNNRLGTFSLTGLDTSMKRGEPEILVKFRLDVNGILHVSAMDRESGKSEGIVVENDRMAHSDDEIQKLVEEAERFEKEDKERKEKVDAMNAFESYVYRVRNALEDEEVELDDEVLETVESAVVEAMEWLSDNVDADLDEILERREEFAEVVEDVFGGAGEEEYDDVYDDDDGDDYTL